MSPTHRDLPDTRKPTPEQLTIVTAVALFARGYWRGLWLAAGIILAIDLAVRVFG